MNATRLCVCATGLWLLVATRTLFFNAGVVTPMALLRREVHLRHIICHTASDHCVGRSEHCRSSRRTSLVSAARASPRRSPVRCLDSSARARQAADIVQRVLHSVLLGAARRRGYRRRHSHASPGPRHCFDGQCSALLCARSRLLLAITGGAWFA